MEFDEKWWYRSNIRSFLLFVRSFCSFVRCLSVIADCLRVCARACVCHVFGPSPFCSLSLHKHCRIVAFIMIREHICFSCPSMLPHRRWFVVYYLFSFRFGRSNRSSRGEKKIVQTESNGIYIKINAKTRRIPMNGDDWPVIDCLSFCIRIKLYANRRACFAYKNTGLQLTMSRTHAHSLEFANNFRLS